MSPRFKFINNSALKCAEECSLKICPFLKKKKNPFNLTRVYVCPCSLTECENLIRRMLAVDPAKRINVAQIKQHRWMQADPAATCQASSDSHCSDRHLQPEGYSEPVLSLMQALGIDKQKTIEVRLNSLYML